MTDLPRLPKYFRTMYGYVIASLEDDRWPENFRRAALGVVGDYDSFVRALGAHVLVVSVQYCPDGLWYTASLRVANGMQEIARVHAANLGLDNEATLRDEAYWAHMRKLTDQPPPDDPSDLDAA